MNYISKYYKKIDENRIQCKICNHYCIIPKNKQGFCKVKSNINNQLIAQNYGAISAMGIDPIEKKPLYHFKPGAKVFSFGCYGCNFKCVNCQNFNISDSDLFQIEEINSKPENISNPEQIIKLIKKYECKGIAYTYSEATVFWEYCEDVIRLAKIELPDLKHIMVTNGYFSNEIINSIISNDYIDAMNIDLKFMNNRYVDICGAELKPIINNIKRINNESNIHYEITNLIIPSLNDSDDDIKTLCEFICDLSLDIPLHFSKYFPYHKSKFLQSTPEDTLLKAKEIANNMGLKYVYIGNTNLNNASNTNCPKCNSLIIKRNNYNTEIIGKQEHNNILCPQCNFKLKIKQ